MLKSACPVVCLASCEIITVRQPADENRDSETGVARLERRIALLVVVAVLAFAFGLALNVTSAFGPVDRWVSDTLIRWRNTPRVPSEIVTVALDSSATRIQHARAITRLHHAGARVIAYDVAFEGSRSGREDGPLLRALRQTRVVVLGALAGDRNAQGYTLPRLFGRAGELQATGVHVGFAAYPREPDGKIRRVAVTPLELANSGRPQRPAVVDPHNLPGFAYAVALAARGGRLEGGVPADNDEIIDFRGPPGTFRFIPFADLLGGRVPAAVFRDKVVIVATTRRFGPVGTRAVPTGGIMDTVEIDANAIATLLYGGALREPTPWTFVLILLVAAFGPLAVVRAGPWSWGRRWLLVPTAAVAIIGGAWPHFDDLIFWPWTYAAASLVVSAAGLSVVLRLSSPAMGPVP